MNRIFSGLVQGLGSSLKEGYDRKNQEKERAKDFLSQSAMYRLQNDENLTGEDQKEGFRQIAAQRGIKIPEEALAALFPDTQIETDKYQNPDIPSALDKPLPEMPNPPMAGSGKQQANVQPQNQGQSPQGGSQIAPDQPDQPQPGMFPMPQPRNPLQQNPAVLGSGNVGQTSSSPVVQNYTSGQGGSYDDLDLSMRIKQLETQLNAPPRQHGTASSLKLSRAQISEMRGRRLRDEQQQRDLTMGQYQDTVKLQQQHREEMRQMQMEAPRMQAHMQAVQAAIGQQLTGDDKKRLMGLNPSAQVESRQLDANDYVLSLHPETPDGAAALSRIRERELADTYKLSAIQENMARITKMMQEKEPTSPQQLARLKIESAKSASTQWTISDQQAYLDNRINYWQQQLQSEMPIAPGMDPMVAQFAAMAKGNPQAQQKLAIELAQKDVAAYKSNLQDKIFTYTSTQGGQVITTHWLRRRAEFARSEARNPKSKYYGQDPQKMANGIWDYYKQQSQDGKATILDDDLEPWSESPSDGVMQEESPGPLVEGAPARKFKPKTKR